MITKTYCDWWQTILLASLSYLKKFIFILNFQLTRMKNKSNKIIVKNQKKTKTETLLFLPQMTFYNQIQEFKFYR